MNTEHKTATWSKHEGRWHVCFPGGRTGQEVTVARQDGSHPSQVMLRERVGENDWGGIYRYEKCGQSGPAQQRGRGDPNRWVIIDGVWMVRILDGKKYRRGDMIDVERLNGERQTRMVLCSAAGLAEVAYVRSDGTYACTECGMDVRPGGKCSATGWDH